MATHDCYCRRMLLTLKTTDNAFSLVPTRQRFSLFFVDKMFDKRERSDLREHRRISYLTVPMRPTSTAPHQRINYTMSNTRIESAMPGDTTVEAVVRHSYL